VLFAPMVLNLNFIIMAILMIIGFSVSAFAFIGAASIYRDTQKMKKSLIEKGLNV
jgi:hypothetical protein